MWHPVGRLNPSQCSPQGGRSRVLKDCLSEVAHQQLTLHGGPSREEMELLISENTGGEGWGREMLSPDPCTLNPSKAQQETAIHTRLSLHRCHRLGLNCP